MKNSQILSATILLIAGLANIGMAVYQMAMGTLDFGIKAAFMLSTGSFVTALAIYLLKNPPRASNYEYNSKKLISPFNLATQFVMFFVLQKTLNNASFKVAIINSAIFIAVMPLLNIVFGKLYKLIDKEK